jgi:DNA polymerase III subunit epsilon
VNARFENSIGTLATNVLAQILDQVPTQLPKLPKAGGIYMLYDHTSEPKYIGMTGPEKGFYDRIYRRHRTGSEHVSHQYSAYYNVGRMWRNRNDAKKCVDSKTSKMLRNKFIELNCSATFVEIDLPTSALEVLETEIIRIAPPGVKPWNGRRNAVCLLDEPTVLVDEVIAKLNMSTSQIEAINRQREKYCKRAF